MILLDVKYIVGIPFPYFSRVSAQILQHERQLSNNFFLEKAPIIAAASWKPDAQSGTTN
jgi:hypothetical protein